MILIISPATCMRGLKGCTGCTSHHTRVDVLDALLKGYVQKVKDGSADTMERLNAALKAESTEVKNNEETTSILQTQLDGAWDELKATKRQRVRDLMKHPEKEEILAKDKLDRLDLTLIIEKIVVYEGRMEIQRKADSDQILKSGILCREELARAATAPPEEGANFKSGIADSLQTRVIQSSTRRGDKVSDVIVLGDGDLSLLEGLLDTGCDRVGVRAGGDCG